MYRLIIFIMLFSSCYTNTIVTLKDGTIIEGEVEKVHRTVLQLDCGSGIMIKLIDSVQTSDSAFVSEICAFYPQIAVEKIAANHYQLDFSALEVPAVEESNTEKQTFIKAYSFNFMLNSQRRHFLEANARIITRYNWFSEIAYSHGTESFPDAISAYNQKLQVDFSTESIAVGFGKKIDIKIGYLLPMINFWLSSSNASIPIKGIIPAEGDSLLLMTNINELVISPGVTFLKLDSGGLLQLMIGVRYFFPGLLLADRGWWIEEIYYPVPKRLLNRGFSIHVGVGINLKVR
jgi:hypothetical protein